MLGNAWQLIVSNIHKENYFNFYHTLSLIMANISQVFSDSFSLEIHALSQFLSAIEAEIVSVSISISASVSYII